MFTAYCESNISYRNLVVKGKERKFLHDDNFCSSQQEDWTRGRFKRRLKEGFNIKLFYSKTAALTSIHEKVKIRGIKNNWQTDAEFSGSFVHYSRTEFIENKNPDFIFPFYITIKVIHLSRIIMKISFVILNNFPYHPISIIQLV